MTAETSRPLPVFSAEYPSAERGADAVREHLDAPQCALCPCPDAPSILTDIGGRDCLRRVCRGHSEHPDHPGYARGGDNPTEYRFCESCGEPDRFVFGEDVCYDCWEPPQERDDYDPRDPESDWECPEHGPVRPQAETQHGGRSRARVCGVDGCQHTVTDTSLDWDAYHEAVENDEEPPCPRCDSEDITEVPTSTPFRCGDCGHSYGYAGGYH